MLDSQSLSGKTLMDSVTVLFFDMSLVSVKRCFVV